MHRTTTLLAALVALTVATLLLFPGVAKAQEEEQGVATPKTTTTAQRVVVPGDSLWSISQERLGPGATSERIADEVQRIYELNRNRIGYDPDLILPGQELSLPTAGEPTTERAPAPVVRGLDSAPVVPEPSAPRSAAATPAPEPAPAPIPELPPAPNPVPTVAELAPAPAVTWYGVTLERGEYIGYPLVVLISLLGICLLFCFKNFFFHWPHFRQQEKITTADLEAQSFANGGNRKEDDEGLNARRLGRILLDEDVITEWELARALDEQRRNGGKLGDILMAQETVDTPAKKKQSFPRLRLAGQIALATLVPLLLPFLIYVLLYRNGIDVSTYVYIGVVVALVVTASLIWVESLQALSPGKPAEEPNEPYPPASAIIAAYLPNEADTIIETVEAFLRVEYPAPFRIILAYNTPEELPIEAQLYDIADRDPRFLPLRVAKSTSKAQNVNVALSKVRGEFVGVFDADHHPDPESFCRAWRWLSGSKEENGEDRYDVVQGHNVVRNGDASWVSRTVAVEFEAIYGVSHPGRTQLHAFGVFGGSNGYWKTDLLRKTKMRGFMLTEDIDSSMRVIETGYKIVSDPLLVSRELAPESLKSLWNQRMRWAQGWFQVSLRHLWQGLRSSDLTLRQKLGFIHLLGWREVYPWISLQIFPVVAFWIWRGDVIDWFVPIFVLTTIFTLSVGPGQTLFAYLLAAPDIRKHKGWFLWYFLVSTLFYTEFKNLISRVAQVKQFMGEQEWKVTARTSSKGPAKQRAG